MRKVQNVVVEFRTFDAEKPTYGKSKSNEIVVGCEPAVLEMILHMALLEKEIESTFKPFLVKSSTVKSVLVETFPARFYLHYSTILQNDFSSS